MNDTDVTSEWRAGTATAVITPDEPMRMAGYGAREEPAEGTLQDLHAKGWLSRTETGRASSRSAPRSSRYRDRYTRPSPRPVNDGTVFRRPIFC